MMARRLSISVSPEVEKTIRRAAERADLSVSAWLAHAAERRNRTLWLYHDESLAAGTVPVVPAVVLAQAWHGGSGYNGSIALGTLTGGNSTATFFYPAQREFSDFGLTLP